MLRQLWLTNCYRLALTFLVRMHPKVGRDFGRVGQLDHVHRPRVATFLAGPALQRGFKFPDGRVPRPANASSLNGAKKKARMLNSVAMPM